MSSDADSFHSQILALSPAVHITPTTAARVSASGAVRRALLVLVMGHGSTTHPIPAREKVPNASKYKPVRFFSRARPKAKHAIADPPYKDKNEGGGTAMRPAASTQSNHGTEMMIVMNAANFRNLLDDKSLLF